MTYILLDESGDLGFSFDKGSSRYFVMAVIITEDIRHLEKIARIVHGGLAKKFKKVGFLHAYQQAPITRKRLLKKLKESDCKIAYVIFDKSISRAHLMTKEKVLYSRIAGALIGRVLNAGTIPLLSPVTLIASRREVKPSLNTDFKKFLMGSALKLHGINLKIEIATPANEKSLQVVDFASWAIYRKYEFNDEIFFDLIRSKLICEPLNFRLRQSPIR